MHWLMKVPVSILITLGMIAWGGAYTIFAEQSKPAASSPPLVSLPANALTLPDFTAFPAGKARKEAFFDYLLPIIEHINSQLRVERYELQRVKEQVASQQALSPSMQRTLEKMLQKYQVAEQNIEDQLAILSRRIDIIPPSLALAQAANESAYGTSRFAVQANNLFGQWCFRKGCGLVPSSRIADANHEVRRFKTPADSVRSYMHNLNTNRAYILLRQMRSKQRLNDQIPQGAVLVNALLKYSSRGQEYVDELASMMRFNKLSRHDDPMPLADHNAGQ